jgi:hypothetical protein
VNVLLIERRQMRNSMQTKYIRSGRNTMIIRKRKWKEHKLAERCIEKSREEISKVRD